MPVKWRRVKRRRALPDVLQRIVDGLPVTYSADAYNVLVAVKYFNNDYADELSDDVKAQIGAIVTEWSKLLR